MSPKSFFAASDDRSDLSAPQDRRTHQRSAVDAPVEILVPAIIVNESYGGAAIELPGEWQVAVGAAIDLGTNRGLLSGVVRHATPTADGKVIIGIEWETDDSPRAADETPPVVARERPR